MSNKHETENRAAGKSLTQQAYDYIIDRLYAGDYRPGHPIDRQEVSRATNISVGTVLIAINSLESDGFVETIPRKGTLVRSVGFQEVYGQLLTREAFECEAARLYCGEPVVENWDRLYPIAQALDNVGNYNADSIHQDAEFHTHLISLTNVPFFIQNYKKTMKMSIFFSFLQHTPELTQRVRASHVRLLERLRNDDPDEAERAVRNHIRTGRPRFFPQAE